MRTASLSEGGGFGEAEDGGSSQLLGYAGSPSQLR